MYIYNHRTTYSGSSRGSSSGAPTSPVGGALIIAKRENLSRWPIMRFSSLSFGLDNPSL